HEGDERGQLLIGYGEALEHARTVFGLADRIAAPPRLRLDVRRDVIVRAHDEFGAESAPHTLRPEYGLGDRRAVRPSETAGAEQHAPEIARHHRDDVAEPRRDEGVEHGRAGGAARFSVVVRALHVAALAEHECRAVVAGL